MGEIYLVMLAAVARAMWVRRHTWSMPWERYVTLAILLSATGLLFATHAGDVTMHEITGRERAGMFTCQVIMVTAAGLAVLHGMMRTSHRSLAKKMVAYPTSLYLVGMTVTWLSGWVAARWVLHFAFLTYLLSLLAWVMWSFVRDSNSRTAAYGAIAVATIGLLSGGCRILQWAGILHLDAAAITGCIAVTVFAVFFTRSWQLKLQPHRTFMQVIKSKF